MRATRRPLYALICACLASACASAPFRPFPLARVMWTDDDMRAFSPPPAEIYTAPRWDSADHIVFRQASEFFLFQPRGREAVDVNALDEVPDSSWFVNRVGLNAMSDEELAQGACPDGLPPPPPWIVTRGKPGGTSPGVVVRAGDGRTYLFKVDFWGQPERATAADAIATRMLYAAGYHTPCNIVVPFRPGYFEIAPDARRSGTQEPYTQRDLDALIDGALENEDGTLRGSLSLYLDGRPLGGWRFAGFAGDDPNDVVPHEDRREVRGLYVFSAWLNHIDARAENNMSLWIDAGQGQGYVRHYVLDAGDSFGIAWGDDLFYGMSARFGVSYYLDLEHILTDFVTLDLVPRSYRDPPRGREFAVFGFYDVERFVPDEWRPGYPNPAFERRTEADCAWAARIVSQMDPHRLGVMASTGSFSRAELTEELVRIVDGRRRRILERYLTRLSPLAQPAIDGDRICLRDLAVESGTRDARTRRHSAAAWAGLPLARDRVEASVAEDGRVCVTVPQRAVSEPLYRVVDVTATSGNDLTGPARLHLYDLPSGRRYVVGLERPSDARPSW